jgi:hypothetical protein
MMIIIIWILFAIGCAISASNKHRNVVGWFLLGILLGPFGLLYILLVNPKEKDANVKYIEQPWETTLRLKKEGKWDGRPLKNRDR